MNNQNILFCFFLIILIIFLISEKKKNQNEKYINIMDSIQDKQIEELKQKLKDK